MKLNFSLLFLFFISGGGFCSTETKENKVLNNYKTYSLARCITNNYKNMGVNFDSLHFKDYTMGFIDIEEGLAFSSQKNNVLDNFIKNKTDHFYKSKQNEGDLAAVNLVIYDCVEFSQSKAVEVFLKNLILKEVVSN